MSKYLISECVCAILRNSYVMKNEALHAWVPGPACEKIGWNKLVLLRVYRKVEKKGRNSDTPEFFSSISQHTAEETVVTSGDYFHHEMKPFLSS